MQVFFKNRNIFLLTAAIFLLSGFKSIQGVFWQEGHIVLENEEKLEGWVSLDHRTHVVLLMQEGLVKAYPAHKVKKFVYLDDLMEMNRNFITYDMEIRKGVKRKVFLEIILDGAIPLLRKDRRIPHSSLRKSISENSFEHEHDYMYYALVNNELLELCQFEEKVLPKLVKEQKEGIKEYIVSHKLKTHVLGHQIYVIDHFNYLANPEYSKLSYDLALLD